MFVGITAFITNENNCWLTNFYSFLIVLLPFSRNNSTDGDRFKRDNCTLLTDTVPILR